ncbi:uncharacterized protein VICG_00384 [Vittaforma corneae ATCC 50505]|uniref:Uncharacterized protein n=1 Tax=Vittaforma corneae (strain ATCC 50505) TaxID=993615 RepID=L2GQP7_VITCO|nr:uncharacterized protein VICG_00384 [Vittaforma corneae ATCC 50505]ELA42632.1 hypothetical protein VICG_00384 [Vittaforma corneae ATCC 50505]
MFQKVLLNKLNLILIETVLCSNGSEGSSVQYSITSNHQFNGTIGYNGGEIQQREMNPSTENTSYTSDPFEPDISNGTNDNEQDCLIEPDDLSSGVTSILQEIRWDEIKDIVRRDVDSAYIANAHFDLEKSIKSLEYIDAIFKTICTGGNICFYKDSIDHIFFAMYIELARIGYYFQISEDAVGCDLDSVYTGLSYNKLFFHIGMTISFLKNHLAFNHGNDPSFCIDTEIWKGLMHLGLHLYSKEYLKKDQQLISFSDQISM